MNFQDRVSIDLADNGVAQVRFTRGDKMNALDGAQFEAVLEAGQALREMKGLRVAVLSGEGRAFCAGLDLSSMAAGGSNPQAKLVDRTHGNANRAQEAAMTWRKCPVPVIAAVHGVCFGGGLQIASGADIRVVHPATRMAVMEMKWGLVPDMGGYALWRGLVRDDILRELTYTNREFSGEEALGLGFATMIDEDPLARATALAETIANKNPDAIRGSKRLFKVMQEEGEDAILLAESREQDGIMRTPNQVEAVMAEMEKRPPRFAD
ncbi:MAG: crotonase/enoyl-CoA hydratase family protein [Pseudomonadota bacterium]|jgi:enoyl-CoA hydratase/carnithine racemase|uniref:crotonase/enoyl-CoA hydratase family protein n=1 Tax=Qipengyuania sp. NPDC077410 TaxID=3364496 RepID=UPI000C517AE4|nr:enoyl-CoA hydratase [Sphingomonadaceae bacterium]MAG41975.1 enoyl-CoA hydratase [Erythrobacteraceae bacterium]MBL4896483.1 crotonase/enoyl-CoA hydratase family protein [Erythrobacter sp.]MEC7889023.1 crotonase/enoyl-CoA hydratase family protein [Pseudomonadota bacterium]MBG74673.1 enoyl-CoA hydratase [Erythrobacteraceae bacterium]|tara:strand:+ start:312 stop:1109 length:798 start_codon:yes stop_codon:yes gene_type:complete